MVAVLDLDPITGDCDACFTATGRIFDREWFIRTVFVKRLAGRAKYPLTEVTIPSVIFVISRDGHLVNRQAA